MNTPDVVVFGEAIWDFFPRFAGESLRARRIEIRRPGGAPANVARTLARLGARTSLVTALGDDELGEAMRDELSAAGVGIECVMRVPARTGVTFVDVRADGARSFLFYRHPSADMMVEPEMLDAAAFRAGFLHLGTSTLTRSPVREATLRAVDAAREAGARISVDVNARKHLWPKGTNIASEIAPLLERADVLKVSEEDLIALGRAGTVAGGRALHAERRDRLTILTLAERGAVAWWDDCEVAIEIPPLTRPVVDVTGAGDAFVAGALATLVHHLNRTPGRHRQKLMQRVLEVGCALGTRAVTQLGATTALLRLRTVAKLIASPLEAVT